MNTRSGLRLRKLDWLLVLISVLVLLACLFYTYAHVFWVPEPGITINAKWVVTSIDPCDTYPGWCEANQGGFQALQVGDQLIAIGHLTYQDYWDDKRRVLFDGYGPGESVPITLSRDGDRQAINWRMPVFISTNRARRLTGLLFYLPFWLAGTVVLLFLQPRDRRWRLLVSFNYLTAVWLAAGIVSNWQVAASSLVFHAVAWLMAPVYLHLHLTVPAPLLRGRSRYFLPPLYAIAAILAILELFQLLPVSAYALGLLLAVPGSLGLLLFRLFDRSSPPIRLAARLMLAGIGLAFGPGIALWLVPKLLNAPGPGGSTVNVAILAVPVLPLFYTYAIYKRRLGDLEFRANRLLSLYSFILLYVSAFMLVFSIGSQWLSSPDSSVVFGLAVSIVFVIAALPLRSRFQHLVDRLSYGTEHDPDDILRIFANRIPAALDRKALVPLLADEVAPSLLIRQSALVLLANGDTNLVYARGVSLSETPETPQQVRQLLAEAGRYRPPLAEAQDEYPDRHKLDWVRLAVPLEIRKKTMGVWLFGRRDPDDYYPQHDIALLTALASQVAISIENARLFEEAQRRCLEQETVSRIAYALSTPDVRDAFPVLVEGLHELTGCGVVNLIAMGEAGDRFFMSVLESPVPIPRGGEAMPLSATAAMESLRVGRPHLTADLSTETHFPFEQALYQAGLRSQVTLPLLIGGEVFGGLNLGGNRTGLFREDQLPVLQQIADAVALALENNLLFRAEHEQRELAESLEEAAAVVSSTLDPQEVLDHILEQAERVVDGDAFTAILIEDDAARLARWRGYELPGEEIQPSRFDIPMAKYSHLMKMARTGKTVIVPDTSLDPNWVPTMRDQAWRRSYVGVPIQFSGVTVGFLGVSGTRPGQFGLEDARRLEALAAHAATAIENARLYERIQQKAEELALLLDTATAVSSTLELDRVLRTLADKMTTSVRATFCRIALLDEMNETLTIRAAFAAHDLDWDPGLGRQYALADAPWHRQVIERGEIMILCQDDPSQAASETECRIALSEGIQSALLMPLVIGYRTLGVVSFGEMRSWERIPFTADRLRLCQAMANQAAVAIRNAQLLDAVMKHRKDLRKLSTQLLNAQEGERRRLSRELHDEIGQALTMMSINLAAIEKELPSELAPAIRERLAEATSLVNQTLEQIRELSLDLRPSTLDELGLVPTLRWYVNRYARRLNIEVELEAIDFEERLTPEMETALYRVVQEALTNVARHAQASRVHVRLERKESAVVALINDNGKGFAAEKIMGSEAPEHGAGLLGIRERVASLGGSFSIQSGPGRGTRLTIEIPLHWGEGS